MLPQIRGHHFPADPLPRLRDLCLGLPEAGERVSHGEPAFFVRDRKMFLSYAEHHHDDRLAFWCAAPPGVQEELLGADPERFFRPPYVGHRGWLGVYLDVAVDWQEVAEIVTEAWRTVAPRTLVAAFDARSRPRAAAEEAALGQGRAQAMQVRAAGRAARRATGITSPQRSQ